MRERSHVRNTPPTEKALRPWTPEAAGRKGNLADDSGMAPQALEIARNGLGNGGRRPRFRREGRCDVFHHWQVGEGVEPAVLGNALRGPHEAAVDPRGSPPSAELVSS